MSEFRNSFGETIFKQKYANHPEQTLAEKAKLIAHDVTEYLMPVEMQAELTQHITDFKFMPCGRYIYYAGRIASFFNNCYLLRGEEDTREEWGKLGNRASDCLMSGGGIGIDYSAFRPEGSPLGRTGGTASGPIPLMYTINELGRNVMQGGSRRSAIYASLNWRHGDAEKFIKVKNWKDMEIHEGYTIANAKEDNFNYHAPLDMTNISLNYDNAFLDHIGNGHLPQIFIDNCRPWLQYLYKEVRIVPIVMMAQDIETARAVGEIISKTGDNIVIVASSDFTHYEPHSVAAEKDKSMIEAIVNLDEEMLYERREALGCTMCGYGPVAAAIVAAREMKANKSKLLKYATSGDTTGDFSAVVGYGSIVMER